MAKHPARPYEGGPIAPTTGGGRPAPAYGTEGAGVTPATSHPGYSRTGRQTPLGPMPTRSPEMSPDESEVNIGGDNTAA